MSHLATHPTIPLNTREFAFVDPSVAGLDVLLRGMRPQIGVSVLSGAEPAPREMARVLAQHQQIDVLHVIAHGRPGEVSFAGGALSLESLDDHRDDLARIGLALAADGEIRLWVCEAAAGDKGAAFIDALARNIGVPVAASAGRVGAAAHGGNWTLDARASGPVLPPLTPAGIAAYAGVLTTFFATPFIDFQIGSGFDDTFIVTSSGQIQPLDTFDGNGGFDRITVTSSFGISVDLSAAAADGVKGFLDIEEIDFDTGGGSSTQTTITLNANQFGAGKIATDAIIDGSIGIDNLVINMTEPGSFDMAHLFFNWTFGSDMVTINGSSGADSITFDDVPAQILAGAGDDTLIYNQTTAVGAGRYDGGAGTDTLQIGTTGDFSTASAGGADGFISIEGIKFVNGFGITTATFDAAQFGAGKISLTSTITGDAGTQGLVIDLARGGSLDLSGLSFSGWTSGTDFINIVGSTGGETIVGTSQSDTIFTGGGGIDVLTGGGGRDTFVYTGADATLQIGGAANTIGSVTGFGVITDFAPGATAATSELLGFSARSIGSSFTTNDSTLVLHTGAVIRSHTISNGIVTFNDISGSQSLITLGDVAAATQYLSFNDWGSAGATLAFTATISGATHTFVYTQTTSLPGITNAAMVDLVNVSATSIVTNGTTLSVLDQIAPNAPSITAVPENGGGGINAAEASDGTPVVVSLSGTGAISNDTLTISWGGQSVNYTLLPRRHSCW